MIRWFCDVGGTIVASRIDAVGVDRVAVVQQPARRLAAAVPGRLAGHEVDRGSLGRLPALDQTQRLVARVDELDAPHEDAAERVLARRPVQPDLGCSVAGRRRQPIGVEREPRHRTDAVRAALAQPRVQRVGALDVLLDEMLVVLADVDVEALARDDATRSIG